MLGTIALLINDNDIVFNHMGAYHPCMLRHSCFASSHYLVVKA